MDACENKPSIAFSFLRKCLFEISIDAKNKGSRDCKRLSTIRDPRPCFSCLASQGQPPETPALDLTSCFSRSSLNACPAHSWSKAEPPCPFFNWWQVEIIVEWSQFQGTKMESGSQQESALRHIPAPLTPSNFSEPHQTKSTPSHTQDSSCSCNLDVSRSPLETERLFQTPTNPHLASNASCQLQL